MEVGAGDTSSFSRQGDNISLLYLVSRFDIDFVEMSVDGGEVMSVFQNDHIAGIKIRAAGKCDDTVSRRFDRRADRAGNVGSLMRIHLFAVHNALSAEIAADAPFQWANKFLLPVNILGLPGQCFADIGTFPVYCFLIGRFRRYFTRLDSFQVLNVPPGGGNGERIVLRSAVAVGNGQFGGGGFIASECKDEFSVRGNRI